MFPRSRVLDGVTLRYQAGIDKFCRTSQSRSDRFGVEQPDTFEGVHDAGEAWVSKGAAEDGRQVAGKAVLREVAERVSVGDTFEGKSSQKGKTGKVLPKEVRACDRDLAA